MKRIVCIFVAFALTSFPTAAVAKPAGYWTECRTPGPPYDQVVVHKVSCRAARQLEDRITGSGKSDFGDWHCEFRSVGYDAGESLCRRHRRGTLQKVRIRIAA